MKKIILFIAFGLLQWSLISCVDNDDDFGPDTEILKEYDLSAGGASQAAKQRIQELFNKYGSYFIYDFEEKDAFWTKYTGQANASSTIYVVTRGEASHVDAMLDYINDIWLKYIPDDVLAKGGIPYRVFLADSMYYYRDWGGGQHSAPMLYNHYMPSGGNSIIISGLNKVETFTEEEKKAERIALISDLFNYYTSSGVLGFPQEFYDLTDYENEPHSTYGLHPQYGYWTYYMSDEDLEAYRNRGFLPNYNDNYGYISISEWFSRYSESYSTWAPATNKTNDLKSYLTMIFKCSDEYMADYLKYPLIKQKWDILLNYYKSNYNLDLRAIALD